jgi:uncharacterized membrane protein YeaQ/YmgE (transglycosylase-associated protein family)
MATITILGFGGKMGCRLTQSVQTNQQEPLISNCLTMIKTPHRKITHLIPPLILSLVSTPLLGATDMDQVTKNAEELANKAASSIESGELFVWIITGLLIGSLVGTIATRRNVGFGLVGNLVLGLLGAFLGGWIFDKLGFQFGLGELVLSYDDLLAAASGALIVVLVLLFVKARYLKARTPAGKKGKE